MSLYDGLDIDSSEVASRDNTEVSGWSSGFKLLQSHSQLQAKKATSSRDKKRSSTSLPPVVDLKRSSRNDGGVEMHFNQLTGKLEKMSTGSLSLSLLGGGASSPFIPTEPMPSLTGVAEEYDPLKPNEYEDYVKKRRDQRKKDREEERRLEIEERERKRRERHRQQHESEHEDSEFERRKRRREEEDEEEFEPSRNRVAGAAIAPPSSLLEDDTNSNEAGASSAELSSSFQPPDFNTKPPPGASFGLGGSVASKIMAKYGYKEGQGLGKKEQGMSMALQVEKTSKRGGKIIHEKDLPKNGSDVVPEPPRADSQTNANLLRNISKVILLRNMVGPGEVDDELEGEVAEECSKYGKVLKCMIFEMPDTVEEEAVRIFLEFERQEAAIKGVVDLNGRFFGGRVVKAGFFNLDRFRQLDLGAEID